ncbi:6-phosphogluconolactonase [Sphaerochaeta globosa]|uniref:6-phosphogluconolactonase n=1 Tax=Sphaerochaeta globosa (strain ATCC BAA-1886 / DSM 22777 / Buddy) TaxID=158189 RepID=F0RVT6_SPHGB|nr:6-phosphogluconolactonase [Sphaerochaeta globosa]ADY13148.1 6-phosphogluconolactonase [Sphaerochaeta globosa str. Buddy]
MRIERIAQPKDLSRFVAQDLISLARQKEGTLHIALPGGRSAQYLVEGLLSLDASIQKRLQLYLVDERLDGETNLATLLQAGFEEAFDLKQLSIPSTTDRLSSSLFDRVYLGVGEDGHIASLFPHHWPEKSQVQVAVIENSPKLPRRRATLTFFGFSTLAEEAKIFLLFLGEGKREALNRLLAGNEQADTLPCMFFADPQFSSVIITDLKE